MLFLITLGLAVLLQVDGRAMVTETANVDECVKEHKLDTDLVAKAVFTGPTVSEDNAQFNILAGCLWDKEGIWTEDHQIIETALLRHIQLIASVVIGGDPKDYVDLAKDIEKACKDIKGNTYGETSTKLQNCINVKAHEHTHKQ